MRPLFFLLAVLLSPPPHPLQAQPAAQALCSDWQTCRDLAEQARAAGDYERFHDLAWRAVQTRGRRDPDLFFLLARAQSLSGRPDDAIVTLQRLAQEMHVAKDVSQDEDFRRVRARPGWPEVEAIIASTASAPEPGGQRLAAGGQRLEAGNPTGTARPEPGTSTRAPNLPPARRSPAGERGPEPAAETSTAEPAWTEVAHFPTRSFQAGGLAYDAVSRRFVIGNLPARKLTIVEEGTNRAATLSGDAAQLLNVRALEIDRSQGDLWVVSDGTRNGSDAATSELHKLQLVSGRVLTIYTPDPSNPSRFVDVAVARGAGVMVLDAAGPRLLRPAGNGKLAEIMSLPEGEVTSLAPADDGRTVYVAYSDRVVRVDTSTQHTERIGGDNADLSGFMRLRWHKRSLVGAQVTGGRQQIVQMRLARNGSRVVAAKVLDGVDAGPASMAALDVLEDSFFYLVPGENQASIRKIRLK